MKKVICFFVCVLICIGFSVKAQVTTSVLGGKIIDDQNEYVIGATVVAVHEPSGTMYGAVTNVDGRYTIQGMRTGGPYKVEISYVGYKKAIFTDIRLELGNTYVLNATLYPSSEQLGEVVVTADAKANIGASENFSTGRIQETPTVDRNIYDVVKNMPMAMTSKNGGITFAGSNNRYNSFQIDGTVSNDVFGLGSIGYKRWSDECQSDFDGCHPGNPSGGRSFRCSPKRFYRRWHQRYYQTGKQHIPCIGLFLFYE